MESKFQTSFIPRNIGSDSSPVKVKTPHSLFFIVSVLLILISILASVGLYAYQVTLQKQLNSKIAILAEKEKTLPKSKIQELSLFADKIDAAKTVLNQHLAITPLFDFLQDSTLKRLKFDELTYNYLSQNKVALAMKGRAKSFEVVAKQSDAFSEFGKNKFNAPIFSDVNPNEKGEIVFSFFTVLSPDFLLYKNTINSDKEINSMLKQ